MESKRCRKCGYWVAKGDKNCKNCGIIKPYNKEVAHIGDLLPHDFNLLECFEDKIEGLVEPGASLMELITYLRKVSSFAVGMFILLTKTSILFFITLALGASLLVTLFGGLAMAMFSVVLFALFTIIIIISGFGSKVLNALRFFIKEIPYKKL